MLFDISELDPRGVGLDTRVDVPPFSADGGDEVTCEPARLVGRLKPTRRGIELTARFDTVAHLHCARCLTAFDQPVGADFRLFLVPPPEEAAPGARGGTAATPQFDPIPEDDPDAIDLYPLEGTVVDFGTVLQEQVDLALPIRAVCREDCRGLCPTCGADLNTEACHCEPERDERFSSLEEFKKVLKKKM